MGDKTSQAAIGISAAAAIAAAIALSRKAQAAPDGAIQLPQELWNLIIAIANSLAAVDIDLDTLITELSKLSISVQGWPPNAKGTRSFAVLCVAANTPYQAADMAIPDGMMLAIKAWPFNAVGSLIFVAATAAECTNPNSSYPLIPNEPIAYAVENANAFFVSSNIAGSIAIFSAEKRG